MSTGELVQVRNGRFRTFRKRLAFALREGSEQGLHIHVADFSIAIKSESSILLIQSSAVWAYNIGVDIAEVRRNRLRKVAKDLGGPAKLAQKVEKSESQISQLIGKNPTRNVGRGLAREIETTLNLEKWWLDGRAEGDAREELIAEMVRELTPEQQDELLEGLRSLLEANKTSSKVMGKKLKTIGNARVKAKFGLPKGAKEKT